MHRIAEPAEDVEVVPSLLVVATRRIIVDADFVVKVFIQFRIEFRLENVFEHGKFALLFGPERLRVVEHFSIAVAEDVGGKPAVQPQLAGLQPRRDDRLQQSLSSLEVLAAHRDSELAREFEKRGGIHREIRSAVGVGHPAL